MMAARPPDARVCSEVVKSLLVTEVFKQDDHNRSAPREAADRLLKRWVGGDERAKPG